MRARGQNKVGLYQLRFGPPRTLAQGHHRGRRAKYILQPASGQSKAGGEQLRSGGVDKPDRSRRIDSDHRHRQGLKKPKGVETNAGKTQRGGGRAFDHAASARGSV
jgi:hypothetical protein